VLDAFKGALAALAGFAALERISAAGVLGTRSEQGARR
jgi:hypothetical protein